MTTTRTIIRRDAADAGLPWPDDALHPVLARVYRQRGIESPQQLERSLDRLLPYQLLGGLNEATALLYQALVEHWRVIVIGDFDADGATSTAVAVRALRMMGAADVDFLVPNRFRFGYGLTPEIVEVAAQRRPQLIITVDNGIASHAGVAAANALGIRVLVTDHHLPADTLPAAEAIVNPNLPGDPFPSKHLAGVGVIFYVMLALRALLRSTGWFAARGLADPNLAQLLDLVALGTVADVVPLDQNNRILVGQGLARIRGGQACAGVRALIRIAGRDASRLSAADLGFALGPRLNAAGRLEDMSLGIACLLCDDEPRALGMAGQLDVLNVERRRIEQDMKDEALAGLAGLQLDDAELPYGLCLYDPAWHQGVIGILASRIKERFHRPTVVFANGDDGEIKGSARSIPGLPIRDVLEAVATRHPGLLSKFGGHSMAAGLTLPVARYDDFCQAFEHEVRQRLTAADLQPVVHSDGELAPDELTLDLAELLRSAGPWGQGFPEPTFDGRFEVLERRVLNERHLKLRVRPQGGGQALDALAFNADARDLLGGDQPALRLAYRLDVNEYRGQRSVQLIVEHLEAV
ncbi:MAG: single-stranded-DNA-specific exonuclease RecJ [Gammaproteobacteria bacterium]|nr:single-stranded-DNA-specific exonuclease RecJ [Gammaproteobacteria bacterium]